MTPREIEIVQQTFEKVRPIASVAAELFYQRLFELDPSIARLFKGDMNEQGRKLMNMIAAGVRGLSNTPALIPVLTDLGRRHTAYGVMQTHYVTVGTALIWTLEQGMGRDFTAEVRDAWCAAYELMAGVMQQGARDVELAVAA
ncbi:MAG: globin family protein [Burkholderiales bacterium]